MNALKTLLTTVKKESPMLYTIVVIHCVIALVCLGGVVIDERTLMGVNVWVKPLKFALSIGIYILTVGYLITLYPFSSFKKNCINTIVSWTMFLEMGLIFYQASRGVLSHYNVSSEFDAILFMAMGILIGINVLIMLFFVVETLRLKLKTTKPLQWSILLGWLLLIFGSSIGGQMIDQMAHNVGIADGGAGLPLLNWSVDAGDLRVAHFFGIHSLQIIPLFALFMANYSHLTHRKQIIIITLFAVLYGTLIGLTFYQAQQGMPFYQ